MTDEKLMNRITANPKIFGGKPIVRGMRISVELILSLLAQGETEKALMEDYPELEPEDIRACLAYAHAVIAQDSLDSTIDTDFGGLVFVDRVPHSGLIRLPDVPSQRRIKLIEEVWKQPTRIPLSLM
jgi:uncharacterized protein (DUF433 family)